MITHDFARHLGLDRGLTAIVGSGGKTTLMHRLAEELAPRGRVILTTSTHIRPSARYETLTDPTWETLSAALDRGFPVCVGSPAGEGKLCAPQIPFARLTELADYVLVEADGSRGLPLKAHLPHEPVIPAAARRTICVVGAAGLDRPIREAVHRPEVFCALTGAGPEDPASPAAVALALNREALADVYYVNQCDDPGAAARAEELLRLLSGCGLAGILL